MVSKLFFLVAVVLFVVAAIGTATSVNLIAWGLASIAAGLLTEGYFSSVRV